MCGASSPCQQDEKLGDRSWGISLFGAGSGISCRGQSRKIQYHINRFSALKILMWLQRGGLQGGGGADEICIEISAYCVCFLSSMWIFASLKCYCIFLLPPTGQQ